MSIETYVTVMFQTICPRSIIVPTDDAIVRKQLRDLDEPMCFFGEGPAERRERLARALAKLRPEARAKLQTSDQSAKTIDDKSRDEIFYYEGCETLKKARYIIADHSIKQCNYRLDMARIKQLEPMNSRLIEQHDLMARIRQIEDTGSYIDEENSTTELKTLTSCSFNPDANLLATSCRSGRCKLWTIPDMETHLVLRGHLSYVNFITFSPKSGAEGLCQKAANLASCSMDGSIMMWNLVDETPMSQLCGTQSWRVTRVRYHPTGLYLGSCCSDGSWRLWDILSRDEILHQEGHAAGVFDLAYHPDGSLVGSAGEDSLARLWDLRTGRLIQSFKGHTKGLRSIDFSPDGYHMATGSMDNTVKVWNLRQRQVEYTIPAHVNTVTTVMFEKENGYYLATASFDKSVRFWSCRTWAPVKALDAYDDKVTNFDLTTKSNLLASCHSKYIKIWSLKIDQSE